MSVAQKRGFIAPPLRPSSPQVVTAAVVEDPGVSEVLEKLPVVHPQDLIIHESLGHGATSSVCRAEYIPTHANYALKTIKFTEKSEIVQSIVNELHTQAKLHHENVVHLFSAFYAKGQIHILMQLIDGASLGDYLKFIPRLPEPALGYLIWQSLQGLLYLRQNHVIHRDLKPSNILLNRSGNAKIADFGMAKQLRESSEIVQSFIGTICYMAPERLHEKDYSFVSDIWSLGLIAYQCALGEFPYTGDISKINYWKLSEEADREYKVQLPSTYSAGLVAFIKRCLQPNPAQRATVEQLVQDPWVLQYRDPSNAAILRQYMAECDAKKAAELSGIAGAKSEFGSIPK